MKVLVVYDTVSPNKNTEKVAKALSEALGKRKGIEVECSYVKNVGPSAVKSYDCVLVGAPTMYWRPTGAVMRFLGGIRGEETRGKFAASFDTQYEGRLAGNAARTIEKKLKDLGFKIITSSLVAYVEGGGSTVQLRGRELEKAAKFAEEIANVLGSQ